MDIHIGATPGLNAQGQLRRNTGETQGEILLARFHDPGWKAKAVAIDANPMLISTAGRNF